MSKLFFLILSIANFILPAFLDKIVSLDSLNNDLNQLNDIAPHTATHVEPEDYLNNDVVWVLRMDDKTLWDPLRLRVATADERYEFESHTSSTIQRYNRGRSTVVKKDASRIITDTEYQKKITKAEIFHLLNKFASYANVEPDAILSSSTNNDLTTLTMYFQDIFALIVVSSGDQEWHFFIKPPSSIPSWFFDDHTNSWGIPPTSVSIPEDVQENLFRYLGKTLRTMINYPQK